MLAVTIRYARIVRVNPDGTALAEFLDCKRARWGVPADVVQRLGLVENSLCEFSPGHTTPRRADTRCNGRDRDDGERRDERRAA